MRISRKLFAKTKKQKKEIVGTATAMASLPLSITAAQVLSDYATGNDICGRKELNEAIETYNKRVDRFNDLHHKAMRKMAEGDASSQNYKDYEKFIGGLKDKFSQERGNINNLRIAKRKQYYKKASKYGGIATVAAAGIGALAAYQLQRQKSKADKEYRERKMKRDHENS